MSDRTLISNLQPEGSNYDLIVKVVNLTISVEQKRADGTKIQVQEAIVADESASICFIAKNEQVPLLQVGSVLSLKNASTFVFNGNMRLSVGRWGSVAQLVDQQIEVNLSKNLSKVDYELVSLPQPRYVKI
eukprot:TRINITY_DN3039_c0_g2_i16.p2 TRINITY_DN3039_c0_g2~~TRINITY_DN3039_c0_g2_i16.p2  ORF type:complete len:131 (-),score=22.07 TRINITY_DN3039_c0_g2_i16:278-670(-)